MKKIVLFIMALFILVSAFSVVSANDDGKTVISSVDCKFYNGRVYADIGFEKITEECTLMLSVYDGRGLFRDLKTARLTLDADSVRIVFDADEKYIGYSLKAFCWNSAIKPVSDVYTAYISMAEFDPEIKLYTVSFETNGGNEIESVKIPDGDSVARPSVPEKGGYVFGGWYSDAGLTQEYDFANKITAHITIYAKWYTVAEQSKVVETINSISEKLLKIRFTTDEKKIINLANETMAGLLADAEAGIAICDGDYVMSHPVYSGYVDEAVALYDAMTKANKEAFYSKLDTRLGQDDAEALLQIMFGMSLDDALDKIEGNN